MHHRIRLLVSIVVLVLLAGALVRLATTSSHEQPPQKVLRSKVAVRGGQSSFVSALGYLEPSGDVRVLAAPIQGVDGSPRLKTLKVEEGQVVRQSQLLATFDTIDRIHSQQNTVAAKIASIKTQLAVLESETNRYRVLSREGVVAEADLESRELRLLQLKADLKQAMAELSQLHTEEKYSNLYAPMSGTVLKINARVGERPGSQGVMEIGANQHMEAIAQVNEDDIGFIHLGQKVAITSENGSFAQKLVGTVVRIAQKVSERKRLTVNPAADSDIEARTIDVRIAIAPTDIAVVRNLTGVKIMATFSK